MFTGPDGAIYYAGGDFSNCTVAVCPVEASVYGYRPSLAASGTLIALYGICLIVQAVLGFRYKTWGFTTAMLLGCLSEIIGYVGRILYWQNPWASAGFIIQIGMLFHSNGYIQTNESQSSSQLLRCFSPLPFMLCSIKCEYVASRTYELSTDTISAL